MQLLLYTILIASFIDISSQHGFLAVPPQRSSLWREEFDNPVNYNDNQLYCGGRGTIQRLGGLCGVCGDPYEGPRENEAGGKYANGIIARRYKFGAPFMKTTVALTAYHKGYFEFRLCPHNNPNVPVKQECLNRHLLPVAEHEDLDSADVLYRPPAPGIYNLTVFLPPGMRCSQCVIQWRYRTGNSWGVDPNGTACTGCGIQEEFRNCADISIGDDELTDTHIQDLIDERFINKDELKNLPEAGEGVAVPVSTVINKPEPNQNSEITKQLISPIKNDEVIMSTLNKIVKDSGNVEMSETNKDKGNTVKLSKHSESTKPRQVKSTETKPQKTEIDSGNSVDRNDVIGGVWSESLEKQYSPRKEKNRLRTLIFGLVKKHNEASEMRKLKKISNLLSEQDIKKINSTPNLRKLAMQLRYLIARYHNRHLYTRLVPSSKKRNSLAIYKNSYNYIAKNSLEAQDVHRSWRFSPDLDFRSSRHFST